MEDRSLGLFEELQEYINTLDIFTKDVPIGIIFSINCKLQVKYSLSCGPSFTNVDEALQHIRDFLDKKGH